MELHHPGWGREGSWGFCRSFWAKASTTGDETDFWGWIGWINDTIFGGDEHHEHPEKSQRFLGVDQGPMAIYSLKLEKIWGENIVVILKHCEDEVDVKQKKWRQMGN